MKDARKITATIDGIPNVVAYEYENGSVRPIFDELVRIAKVKRIDFSFPDAETSTLGNLNIAGVVLKIHGVDGMIFNGGARTYVDEAVAVMTEDYPVESAITNAKARCMRSAGIGVDVDRTSIVYLDEPKPKKSNVEGIDVAKTVEDAERKLKELTENKNKPTEQPPANDPPTQFTINQLKAMSMDEILGEAKKLNIDIDTLKVAEEKKRISVSWVAEKIILKYEGNLSYPEPKEGVKEEGVIQTTENTEQTETKSEQTETKTEEPEEKPEPKEQPKAPESDVTGFEPVPDTPYIKNLRHGIYIPVVTADEGREHFSCDLPESIDKDTAYKMENFAFYAYILITDKAEKTADDVNTYCREIHGTDDEIEVNDFIYRESAENISNYLDTLPVFPDLFEE